PNLLTAEGLLNPALFVVPAPAGQSGAGLLNAIANLTAATPFESFNLPSTSTIIATDVNWQTLFNRSQFLSELLSKAGGLDWLLASSGHSLESGGSLSVLANIAIRPDQQSDRGAGGPFRTVTVEGGGDVVNVVRASQVFVGPTMTSQSGVAFAGEGSLFTIETDQQQSVVVLHDGQLIADSGHSPFVLRTHQATVTVQPDSAALVVSEPGKRLTRVMAVGGKELRLQSQSLDNPNIVLKPGEILTIGDESITGEELIPVNPAEQSLSLSA